MVRTSPLNREAYGTYSEQRECYDVTRVYLLLGTQQPACTAETLHTFQLVVAFSIGPPSVSLDITSKWLTDRKHLGYYSYLSPLMEGMRLCPWMSGGVAGMQIALASSWNVRGVLGSQVRPWVTMSCCLHQGMVVTIVTKMFSFVWVCIVLTESQIKIFYKKHFSQVNLMVFFVPWPWGWQVLWHCYMDLIDVSF